MNRATIHIQNNIISIVSILMYQSCTSLSSYTQTTARIGERSSSFLITYLCSQLWFPTVQEVLQADWQDVWHSPHPPFLTVFCNLFVLSVFTCFILFTLLLFIIFFCANNFKYYSIHFFLRKEVLVKTYYLLRDAICGYRNLSSTLSWKIHRGSHNSPP